MLIVGRDDDGRKPRPTRSREPEADAGRQLWDEKGSAIIEGIRLSELGAFAECGQDRARQGADGVVTRINVSIPIIRFG